jgi:TonB family protein
VVLALALAIALGGHAGALIVYETLRPTPLPRLYLRFEGKGAGSVMSIPEKLSCSGNCSVAFEPGTTVRLVAVLQAGSTFEGWAEGCTPRPDWILECELTVEQDTRVRVGFGRVPEEVEVAMVPQAGTEAEENEPPVTLTRTPRTKDEPQIEAELLIEPLAELLPEIRPEDAKPEQPEPEQPPSPPPPPMEQLANMRSVEVPDENEVEKAPDDATHLSDKNRDVAEETRAVDTNLERAQTGDSQSSEESDVKSEDIGGEKAEIAQLEEMEPSTLDEMESEENLEEAPDQVAGAFRGEAGERGQEGEEGDDRPMPGALSMRGVEGRGSLMSRDPGLGTKSGTRGKEGSPGIKTQLEFSDYERIVGKETAERELALGRKKKPSMRRGRFERKMGVVKSALENFTPEVKPGNQTALKTRAAPFAVYIARMHRRIHELWAFGFIESLDSKPSDHPFNNWNLQTVLEIVVNPDGTVHKVNIVKPSGLLEFDVAAIDVILTAEPYEPSPEQIRSPDGRVYMHWGFHRNHLMCGTFNAQPFILAEAPKDSGAADDGALVRSSMPRRRSAARQETSPDDTAPRNARAQAGLPSSTDPEAMHAANLWLNGFSQFNLAKMLKVTGAPFQSGEAIVASSVSEVGNVYKTLLQESGGGVRDWKLMTPAGYRKRFDALPTGIEEGKPQLLMVVRASKEQFTLVLARQENGSYAIVGLHR